MTESDWEPEPRDDPGDDADFPEDPLLDDEDGGAGLEPAEEEED